MPFIEISSSQWTPFLETGLHDLYHLPEYVALEAEWMKGEPLGWICSTKNGHCLIPLIRRNINIPVPQMGPISQQVYRSSPEAHVVNEQLFDLISPYGYPGILPLKQLAVEETFRAMSTFQTEAKAAGYICSFIRLHPFLNNWLLSEKHGMTDLTYLPAIPDFSLCNHGTTLSIDIKGLNLKTSDHGAVAEHLMSSFSLNHRRNLRHLHHEGYSAVLNVWKFMPDFTQAYTATMIRRKAASKYLYTEEYFNRLRCITGQQLFFITVLTPDGEFCCGGLFSLFGRTMQYLFGATAETALRHSPAKLMMEESINLGIKKGAEVLHLGGGVGAEATDGVFRFKQGFAHQRHAFHCLHFIHRPEIYHRLVQAHNELLAENPRMLFAAEESLTYGNNTRFFPSYRASND